MKFHYSAFQPNGKVTEGVVEADSSAKVLEYLASQGLRPVSLKVVGKSDQLSTKITFGKTITTEDKVFLTKYLALMLKVGTDLFKAIEILVNDFEKPAMKDLLSEIKSSLEKGQPFYTTFAKYPQHFSPVFVNLVKAGEASGNLEKVFSDLSISLQREQDLRNQVKSALTYPVILLIAAFFILIFLVTFALPKIANVFLNSGIKPPLFSRIVFTAGLFISKYIVILLLVFGGIAFALWYYFGKNQTGKKIFSQFLTKAPVIGKVIKEMAIQRFAATFSSLLKAGLPLLEAMEITASAVGSEELKTSLLRISREGIAKGLTIGDAFRRESYFPRVVVNLIAISEKAGHIEGILATLADFYESEIQSSVKSLMTFVEPIMLLGIGIGIGTIALAIIVPVYQLVGQF